jgi:hypothetical protein
VLVSRRRDDLSGYKQPVSGKPVLGAMGGIMEMALVWKRGAMNFCTFGAPSCGLIACN